MLERAVAVAMVTLLTVNAKVGAQTPPTSNTALITGLVVDSATNTPITAANVDVRVAGVAASVAHATTGADGSFRVEGLQPGRYSIRIRALGYTPRPLAPIELRLPSSNYDVGTVVLNAAPVQLQSLQVTGQRQEVQLAPDRNAYIVRDMPTTRGGTGFLARRRRKRIAK